MLDSFTLYAWLHTHEGKKIFRYTMVSVISTTSRSSSSPSSTASSTSGARCRAPSSPTSSATFPSYWLNRSWAWGKHGQSHFLKEVVPFWILSFIGMAFSIVGAAIAGHFAGQHSLSHAETTVLVHVANLMTFAILWIVKFVIYNKLFHHQVEHEEYDEHLDRQEEEHEDEESAAARPRSEPPDPGATGLSPGSSRTAGGCRSPPPCTWR